VPLENKFLGNPVYFDMKYLKKELNDIQNYLQAIKEK
jgi:hypothetical protein